MMRSVHQPGVALLGSHRVVKYIPEGTLGGREGGVVRAVADVGVGGGGDRRGVLGVEGEEGGLEAGRLLPAGDGCRRGLGWRCVGLSVGNLRII